MCPTRDSLKVSYHEVRLVYMFRHFIQILILKSFTNVAPYLFSPCLQVAQNSNFSKTGWYFAEKMSSGFPTTALPQLCDSRRFLKATCKLPADRSCSCNSGLLLGTAPLNKRLQTDRTVVGHQRENQRTFFSAKYDPVPLKFCAILCNINVDCLSFVFWNRGLL